MVSCFKINQALHVACLCEINACSPSEIRYYYNTLRESTVIVAGLADRSTYAHAGWLTWKRGDRADM